MSRAVFPSLLPLSLFLSLPLSSALIAGCTSGDDDAEREPLVETNTAPLVTTGNLVADAHVRSTSAGTNYGTATTLLVDGNDGGAVMHTYLRFSVGDVGPITSAKLRIYVTNASGGPNEVRRVSSNSWTESGLTWNNKPATGALVATIGVGERQPTGWRSTSPASCSRTAPSRWPSCREPPTGSISARGRRRATSLRS